jgi:3-oxoacyl-[acyl-carrier-protein] synthase-1
MTARAPCALRAAGLVTTLGVGADPNGAALVAGDTSRLDWRDDLVPGRRYRFGSVDDALVADLTGIWRQTPRARLPTRTAGLLLAAAAQIAGEVAAVRERFGPTRLGVVVGTSTAGYLEAERAFRARAASGALPTDFELRDLEVGRPAEQLAAALDIAGPSWAISTACSSGAKAIAAARELILAGVCDAVIAGGADSLCATTAGGFHALQALARDRTLPLSRRRDGLTLGEGAALFLITRDAEGVCLLGSGEGQDAHHMSAPDPEGSGAQRAMHEALADAAVPARAIDYVNLHGTGTPANDAMEARAVSAVFGSETPCSSTKPLVGHTLAAAGAVEAAFCWLVARAGANAPQGERPSLPPHAYDGDFDPALPKLRLVARGERAANARPLLLSASFGFGGSNAALVIGEPR